MSKDKIVEHHHAAAEHHEHAAKHHRKAAKHHESDAHRSLRTTPIRRTAILLTPRITLARRASITPSITASTRRFRIDIDGSRAKTGPGAGPACEPAVDNFNFGGPEKWKSFFGSAVGIGTIVLLVAALFMALGFEFVNGFHDTANAVATVIYTHSLPPHSAVVWSGICNFLGVLTSSRRGRLRHRRAAAGRADPPGRIGRRASPWCSPC